MALKLSPGAFQTRTLALLGWKRKINMSSSNGTPQGIIKSTVATGFGDVLNQGSIAANIGRSMLVKGFDGKYQSFIK